MSSSRWRQLEATLGQSLSDFYFAQLGHRPARVTCQRMDSQIVITIEGALTQLEQLLNANTSLGQELRTRIDQVLRMRLKNWVVDQIQDEVGDLWVSTNVSQDQTMVIVILTDAADLGIDDRPVSG